MKQEVKIGQTDYTVLILIRDTAGAPKTGLTNASAGIDVCYTRVQTDNDVVLTAGAPVALATPALTDVHLDWGFLQVDATNAPGLYRFDIADGVFASGAWSAVVSLIATGIDPCQIEFILVPVDPYTGVNVSTIGGTAQTANDNGADINDILVDTAVIGALGAGLTAIPWNAAWDAEVQSECDDAITANLLILDIPSTAEFNARTIISADYVVVGDTIAAVTTVGTVTGAITDKTGYAIGIGGIGATAFAANAINAAALAADAVDEIIDEVVEGTTTLRQATRLTLSTLTGKSSGGGTATVVFRDIGDTKNRISATVDADGNRTAVGTRDGT